MTGQQINPRNCGVCGNREYHSMGLARCKINKELVQKGDPQYEWSCILGCGSCINEGNIVIIVELGGKSVCGMENRPDSCIDCSEVSNCVLDLFYEQVSKIRSSKEKKQ